MKEMLSEKEDVALLWTGGWDSTFQLLQLLIIHRSRVTPFYLIDTERRSTGAELLTMRRIKDRLLKDYPHTQELLQATKYFAVADISPDSEITEAFRSLLKEKFMGSQYDWLPRFCRENGIADIQLCIHRDDKAHFVIEQIVSESTNDAQSVFRVDPRFEDTKEYLLFRHFSFPIFNLTKLEMSAIADRHGWGDIMGMTWFCHTPTHNMNACGKCNPCQYAIEEGLGWRIPARGRLVALLHKSLVRPLRSIVRPLRSLAKIMLSKLGLLEYFRKSV